MLSCSCCSEGISSLFRMFTSFFCNESVLLKRCEYIRVVSSINSFSPQAVSNISNSWSSRKSNAIGVISDGRVTYTACACWGVSAKTSVVGCEGATVGGAEGGGKEVEGALVEEGIEGVGVAEEEEEEEEEEEGRVEEEEVG